MDLRRSGKQPSRVQDAYAAGVHHLSADESSVLLSAVSVMRSQHKCFDASLQFLCRPGCRFVT